VNLITSRALVDDLVVANRILAELGVLDAFGHVSVRSDADPRRYVLTRLLAPEMVTRDDLIEYDLDSRPVHDDDRKPCLERFIHGEIYKARPDVLAVVHSHAPSVIPFAASSVRLRPIYHMGAFLGRGAPVFDIRKRFGATDLLVRNPDHGRVERSTKLIPFGPRFHSTRHVPNHRRDEETKRDGEHEDHPTPRVSLDQHQVDDADGHDLSE